MPASRQILNAIALAANSNIRDAEFRALVVELVQPNRESAVPETSPTQRERHRVSHPELTTREALPPPSPLQNPRPGSTTYYYKLFRVKRADGRVTTVSVDPVLVEKAVRTLGGTKEVGALVRKLALGYLKTNDVQSCSRFVSRGLFTAMAAVSATAVELVDCNV